MPVQRYVDRETKNLRKAHAIGSAAEKEPTAVLKRFLARRREQEMCRLREDQDVARKNNAKKQRAKAVDKAVKARAKRLAADKKKRKLALALLPERFTVVDLGQAKKNGGGKAHFDSRIAFFECLRARSPKLPDELDKLWLATVKRYSTYVGRRHQEAVGTYLMESVEIVTKRLGVHLLPDASGVAVGPSGSLEAYDEGAFEALVGRAIGVLPKVSEMTL